MPSTYSTSLGLELIGNGEQAGTWGTTTNNNLGTLVEAAIAGVQPITLTGTTYTLTDYNGLPDESRNAVLMFNGLLAAPCNVIAPAVEKTYIVRNRSNATVTIKTASGNGISIANAASEVIFCDGVDFYSATQFNYVNGNLIVTGNVSVGGNMAVVGNSTFSGTVTLASDVFGNTNTGQWYIPKGNTAARTATGTTGLIRYNTEANFYEGYANGSWVRFLVANQGSYTITYLIVGGGGGGYAGGGGGSTLVTSTTPAIPATTVLTMTIGGGGAVNSNGTASTITGVGTCIGGGNGLLVGTTPTVDGGRSAAGFTGGYNYANAFGGANGGGAGAGANGGDAGDGGANNARGGNGGAGLETLITGTSLYLAGGGGGGAQGPAGTGVNGGGNGNGGSGTANMGGGGGGGVAGAGSSGGSGVIYLSMPTVNYTGTHTGSPTVTTTGSNTVLKYTGSGTYTA